MFEEFFEDNKRIIYFGVSGLFILIIAITLSSPIIALEITFGISFLISLIVVLAGLLLDYIVSNWIAHQVLGLFYSERIISGIKIAGIVGIIWSIYSITKNIIEIDWQNWGIKSFYKSMESQMITLEDAKFIFEADVWPNYVHLLKAILINIGGILKLFIINFVPPFSWIFGTIGLFKN